VDLSSLVDSVTDYWTEVSTARSFGNWRTGHCRHVNIAGWLVRCQYIEAIDDAAQTPITDSSIQLSFESCTYGRGWCCCKWRRWPAANIS
jgi:hypothetical protein